MTCSLRTVNSVLRSLKTFTDHMNCTDRTNWMNPSKNIRAKQRNIPSVDNDMQFTNRKLFLTVRQNLHGPYKLYGPYELNEPFQEH